MHIEVTMESQSSDWQVYASNTAEQPPYIRVTLRNENKYVGTSIMTIAEARSLASAILSCCHILTDIDTDTDDYQA